MPDSGQDALSLTLPKVGSRTKTKRRKLPKPPKGDLFWVVFCAFFGLLDALQGRWISFGFMMFMLAIRWADMVSAMRLRRPPWWHRGPAEAITLVAMILGAFTMTLVVGN